SAIPADQIPNRPECAAEIAAACLFLAAVERREHPVGQPRERQRLHPDAPRPGHRREEQSLASEQRRLDPADELDVVDDRRVEGDEAAGVDLERLARFQLERHDRAAAVHEQFARALEALENETLATEEPGAEPLRER